MVEPERSVYHMGSRFNLKIKNSYWTLIRVSEWHLKERRKAELKFIANAEDWSEGQT